MSLPVVASTLFQVASPRSLPSASKLRRSQMVPVAFVSCGATRAKRPRARTCIVILWMGLRAEPEHGAAGGSWDGARVYRARCAPEKALERARECNNTNRPRRMTDCAAHTECALAT